MWPFISHKSSILCECILREVVLLGNQVIYFKEFVFFGKLFFGPSLYMGSDESVYVLSNYLLSILEWNLCVSQGN